MNKTSRFRSVCILYPVLLITKNHYAFTIRHRVYFFVQLVTVTLCAIHPMTDILSGSREKDNTTKISIMQEQD